MAKIYKVWIQVEMIDDENDIFENITEPEQLGEEFKTRDTALEFFGKIQRGESNHELN